MKDAASFQSLAIFQGMSLTQLEQILRWTDFKALPAGKTIFSQDSDACEFYILNSGRVAINYKPYDGPALTIATILPGWVFGWSVVLGRKKYTSTAIALEDSSALCISRNSLRKICEVFDDTGIIFFEHITANITERLNQTGNHFISILSDSAECKTKG